METVADFLAALRRGTLSARAAVELALQRIAAADPALQAFLAVRADEARAQVITPETGLIGIPQQIQWGVKFKTLLDPRIKVQFPCYQVKLDSTTIAQLKRTLNTLPSMQDWGGYYNVAGVRHFGNSRGNDWYTEVTSVTPAYGLAGMLAENYA